MPRHRILATEEPRKGRRRHPTKRAASGSTKLADGRPGAYHVPAVDDSSGNGIEVDSLRLLSQRARREFQAVIWSREGAEGYHRVDGQREAGQGRSPKPARATTSPRPLPPSSSTPHPTETQLPVRTAIKVDQHSFALQPNALLDALEKDIRDELGADNTHMSSGKGREMVYVHDGAKRSRPHRATHIRIQSAIALELGIILRLSLIVFITEVTKTSMPMRRRGVTVIPKCSQPPRRDGDEGASELLHPRTEW
ncbi:hypothetical protein R3P38DRAFT_2812484 [Favolaschia claudopus]|uniref:Uncharacterized protein n=1 Tax=Favolaschia claudopus TaxID=2862362 RepID=A0AAV9Z6A7_9AGAR